MRPFLNLENKVRLAYGRVFRVVREGQPHLAFRSEMIGAVNAPVYGITQVLDDFSEFPGGPRTEPGIGEDMDPVVCQSGM